MADAAVTHTFAGGSTILSAQVNTNFSNLLTFLNTTGVHKYQALSVTNAALGAAIVDSSKATAAFLKQLGLTGASSAAVRRDSVIIATEQTTSSAAAVVLSTPDRVTVDVPANSIIRVRYMARWKRVGASGNAFAQLCVNGTPVTHYSSNVGSDGAYANNVTTTGTNYTALVTAGSLGLSCGSTSRVADLGATSTSVATVLGDSGQLANASSSGAYGVSATDIIIPSGLGGTYTVDVRFGVAGGATSCSVKDRRLWVEVLTF